jgi:hypothetical protein
MFLPQALSSQDGAMVGVSVVFRSSEILRQRQRGGVYCTDEQRGVTKPLPFRMPDHRTRRWSFFPGAEDLPTDSAKPAYFPKS